MKPSIPPVVMALALAFARVAIGGDDAAREPLVTCLAAAADHSPIWPTKTFRASEKQMVCVFRLGEDESFEKLTSKWVAVDVGDAAPPNTLIVQADLDLKGQKAGRLRYSQPGPLPVGKYRLDVLGDGKPWQAVEFEVVADPEPLKVAKPGDLLPLTEGRTWTYKMFQEAGPGVKLSAAGEKLEADGTLRAAVTITVGKSDDSGTPIVVNRNGKVVTEEWWALGPAGVSATRRRVKADDVPLDPPQPLLPIPRGVYASWTYAPKDRSFSQDGQVWGPLPIEGPSGKVPGFLTVLEQSTPTGKVTVERHVVPGVGMVKEVMTSTLGPKLLSRQVLTLVEGKAQGKAAPRDAPGR